jgi:osmoprotectant transport system permease protein
LAEWGVGGIGYAPAFLALCLYALLPVVANTVLGLEGTPQDVIEAARGMGLTERQILIRIRWPLALPTIVTGARVVLVQNIGLAAVAALVGGGGLGAFIFQGIGQTAIDLVLLGALPTVALALAAGVILDAVVEQMKQRRAG